MRVFVDLETEAKARGFLNYKDLRVWFLTDLENNTVVQLSQTAEPKDYIYSVACVAIILKILTYYAIEQCSKK